MAVFSRIEHFLGSWDKGSHHHNACPISGGAGTLQSLLDGPCSSSCLQAPAFHQPLPVLPGERQRGQSPAGLSLFFPVGHNSVLCCYFLSPLFLLASEKISCQLEMHNTDKSSALINIYLRAIAIMSFVYLCSQKSVVCQWIFCIRQD